MSPKIKVSVIIPVYNVEKYIVRCLESIRTQNLAEIEVIMINDASEDSSQEYCKKYTEIDSRFKLYHNKGKGVSAARNTGLALAKGEYIGFVDSDDSVSAEMFEIMYENAKNKSADICFCDCYRIYSDNAKETYSEVIQGGTYDSGEIRDIILKDYLVCVTSEGKIRTVLGAVWRKLFRREFLEKRNIIFDESLKEYEDQTFCLRCLIHADLLFYLKRKFLYNYYINPRGITHKCNPEFLEDVTRFMDSVYDIAEKYNVPFDDDTKKLFEYECLQYAYLRASNGFSVESTLRVYKNFKMIVNSSYFREAVSDIPYYSFDEELSKVLPYTKEKKVWALVSYYYKRMYGKSALVHKLKRVVRRNILKLKRNKSC